MKTKSEYNEYIKVQSELKPIKRDRISPLDRPAEERIKDFKEVNLGFTEIEAMLEAERCLDCKNPTCIKGCPVNIDIPGFIVALREGEINKSYDIITKSHAFPCITGRVCPQERQCEEVCILQNKNKPVNIGKLERYVGDHARIEKTHSNSFTHSVGIVGSGPGSMALAADLLKHDIKPVIYEAFDKTGGVLTYGIPSFRLPREVTSGEIDNLIERGLEINKGIIVGKSISIDELLVLHDFVFVGSGAGLPKLMGIKGEEGNNVLTANEFLTRVNLLNAGDKEYLTPMPIGKSVAVIGGGNVAMDAARVAIRLYDRVDLFYRRNEENMSARIEEIAHAKEEGVVFHFGLSPMEIKDDNIIFKKGEIEESFSADIVVVAIGTEPNKLMDFSKEGISTKDGLIVVDDNLKTTKDRVYAGGDVVTGAATVIEAYGAGKRAAKSIIEELKK
ncbi:MAG: FAD-dependent oxidoreductase [Ezakiella sp.]|nr:FAD-dependent oxidoreductase [Ezakiella sp.]